MKTTLVALLLITSVWLHHGEQHQPHVHEEVAVRLVRGRAAKRC